MELQADSNYVPETSLVKYGSLEHMKALYKDGEVFLRPASHFASYDTRSPRHDDELRRQFEGQAQVQLGPTELANNARVKITVKAAHDYYVYCLSKRLSPVLLETFEEADACVVMHDGKAFCSRCLKALFESTDGLAAWANDVRYFEAGDITRNNVVSTDSTFIENLLSQMGLLPDDPKASVLKNATLHDVCLRKPGSFEYQVEYRCIAWFPLEPGRKLDPSMTVHVGSLKGAADLLVLDKSTGTFQKVAD